MFYEDNGFRDMLIYGSAALLATLAMPAKRAHAAEIYLCADGRMLEVDNASRTQAIQDTCVASWYAERDKAIDVKLGRGKGLVAAWATGEQTSGYQIQTAAIEPLVNAVELPDRPAASGKPRLAAVPPEERRARVAKPRHGHSSGRTAAAKGLRYMGDGIYAE